MPPIPPNPWLVFVLAVLAAVLTLLRQLNGG
jgi:hypothetical protein